jgi:hypothetical protein
MSLCWFCGRRFRSRLGRAGAEVSGGDKDEFVAQGVVELFGVGGIEQGTADAKQRCLQHGGDQFRVAVEGVAGAGEHGDDGFVGAKGLLLVDFGAVDVGDDGVEGDAGLDVFDFDFEVRVDESFGHLPQGFAVLCETGLLDGAGDDVEVACKGGAEQGGLVREVLVEGADGDAGAVGDAGGGEAVFADGEQNLNGGLQHGVHAGGGAGLDGRFAGFQEGGRGGWQMRTPNLKLSSSNHR